VDESQKNEANNSHSNKQKTSQSKALTNIFGKTFPYEQIVIMPTTFTRANYAKLVTGWGTVPSFPTSTAYKSVELIRFQRQLRQSAFGHVGNEAGHASMPKQAADAILENPTMK